MNDKKNTKKEYSSILKYLNADVTFAEVPDEISLCINITNCPCRCDGCHSPELSKDIGEPLTTEVLDILIKDNEGISCVCLMGGDRDPKEVERLLSHIKKAHPKLKTAWYSGRTIVRSTIYDVLDYIKIGPYIKQFGGLDKRTTNQRFYKVTSDKHFKLKNITYKFRHEKDS